MPGPLQLLLSRLALAFFFLPTVALADGADTIFRRLAAGGTAELRQNVLIDTTVAAGTQSSELGLLSHLVSHADAGEHVAIYGQARKYGKAPAWAGVFELHDHSGEGDGFGFWAVEVDAMVKAGAPAKGIGLGIVVGRASESVNFRDPAMPPGTLDAALWVGHYVPDYGKVAVNYGLVIDVPCKVACIKLPADGSIQLDEDYPGVMLRFDSLTRYVGFWSGPTCLWCVSTVTGEERHMWRP